MKNSKKELVTPQLGVPPHVTNRDVMLSSEALHAQFNFMLGRLKTVIDASVSNQVQNKALKDLVSQEVWHRYNYILEITGVKGRIINDGNTEIS